ncbi:hypothetical protein NSQ54_17375 [Alkalihalobacillus sp. FSL W8-0930]
MTSFLTLLKRDLRLQVPMMVIYSAVLVLIAVVFTWLAVKFNEVAYEFIPFLYLSQFIFLGIALPINAIWKEWRMKTVAHWLMLPTSVHKKIWSKALSVVIWTLYIIVLVIILWAITGLIGKSPIHDGSYELLKFILSSDLMYLIPFSVVFLTLGIFPFFIGVIMVKGEKGWKGPVFALLLIILFVGVHPWIEVAETFSFLEIGPIYMETNFTQAEFTFSNSEVTFSTTGNSDEPITYVSSLIFDLILYSSFYFLTWWYLARKVEI